MYGEGEFFHATAVCNVFAASSWANASAAGNTAFILVIRERSMVQSLHEWRVSEYVPPLSSSHSGSVHIRVRISVNTYQSQRLPLPHHHHPRNRISTLDMTSARRHSGKHVIRTFIFPSACHH